VPVLPVPSATEGSLSKGSFGMTYAQGVSTLLTLVHDDTPEEIPHSRSSFGMTYAQGVSTLLTLVHDDTPEEIPHSRSSFGMTYAQGRVTPSDYAARSLYATNLIT